MKRFIFRIVSLFFIPLIAFFAFNEYYMRHIPNDYVYKNQWMHEHANEVKILNLGSSHAYNGIDPYCFDKLEFNLGHPSQSLKYDCFLFDKYIDSMDSLQYLILPISYFTLYGGDMEDGSEWWRVKYYCIYYDCPFHKNELRYNFESMSYTGITAFQMAFKNITHRECNDLGGSQIKSNFLSDDNALDVAMWAAGRHTQKKVTQTLIDKNIAYVEHIIKVCQEHNVSVILLTTPTYYTYRSYINSSQWLSTRMLCENIAKRYSNVMYVNLFDSSIFNKEDFVNADHLNATGAAKLSSLLNQITNN